MQNQVAIVMCNRVGKEGDVTFAGQSVVVDPYGNVVSKADDQEQLIIADIDLTQTAAARNSGHSWNCDDPMVRLKGRMGISNVTIRRTHQPHSCRPTDT